VTVPHYHRCVGVGGQVVNVQCDCSRPSPVAPPMPERRAAPARATPSPAAAPVERFVATTPDYSNGSTPRESYREERARVRHEELRCRLGSLENEAAWSVGKNEARDAEIRRLNRIVNRRR
jgi:hypothetical protein